MSTCIVALTVPSRFISQRTSVLSARYAILTVSGWSVKSAYPRCNKHVQRSFVGSAPHYRAATIHEKIATRRSAVSSKDGENEAEFSKNKKKLPKSKKFRIAEQITEANMDKLAAAFDELARKEGFDTSLQHFADDATFEDDFEYDDDDFLDSVDDDNVDVNHNKLPLENDSHSDLLDPTQFQLSDFAAGDEIYVNEKAIVSPFVSDDDMDARDWSCSTAKTSIGRSIRFGQYHRFIIAWLPTGRKPLGY
jgi:hypothetical protein